MQKITLDDQKWLTPLLKDLQPTLSEYTFGNLLLFQPTHQYEWFDHHGKRYIKGISYTKEWFWIPLFQPMSTDLLDLQAQFLYPISDEWKKGFDVKTCHIEFHESESDYLYLTESIKTYAGRALDGRRNLVHQFLDHYVVESHTIDETNRNDAQIVIDKWYEYEKIALEEVQACTKSLEYWNELSLFGRITYTDGTPSAIVIGEPLNEETFVIHFAKAVRDKKGIYQYLHQDLALSLPSNYLYLNWEQDLGIDGLKHAKEAYKPLLQLKKWRISAISEHEPQT